MSLNEKRDDFERADFRRVGEVASMGRGRADAILEEVIEAVADWPRFAADEGVPKRDVERIAKAHRLALDEVISTASSSKVLRLNDLKILALGDRDPSFLTHRELDAAFELMPAEVESGWTATDSAEARDLESADGVWLMPGTPYRDDDAAYAAIEYCRTSGTPFLGTCGGFQYACVHLSRTLAGHRGSGARRDRTRRPRSGGGPAGLHPPRRGPHRHPVPGTRFAEICGEEPFDGFHFCGFGLDPAFEARLAAAGVVLAARAPDAGVEAIELPEHPFFIATAFQPQVGNGEAGALHPLITALLDAAAAPSAF